MTDPIEPVSSIRSIINNADYFANWITTIVTAGSFSILVSLNDKLTGAALAISFCSAVMFAMVGWPVLLQYGYGRLDVGLAYGAICGIGGITLLLTLIGVVRRVYARRNAIADAGLKRVGVPESTDEKE